CKRFDQLTGALPGTKPSQKKNRLISSGCMWPRREFWQTHRIRQDLDSCNRPNSSQIGFPLLRQGEDQCCLGKHFLYDMFGVRAALFFVKLHELGGVDVQYV